MAKVRTTYFCQNCGVESPKWIGNCPSCNEWNTYVEEVVQKKRSGNGAYSSSRKPHQPQKITEVNLQEVPRLTLPDAELNRVLGNGVVPGSVILIGGEPGIGKSTLVLQTVLMAEELKVLYVSGEESDQQLRMRAERVGQHNENCYILTETDTHNILSQIEKLKPGLVVIDSVQTLHTTDIDSPAGSVSQIRESAGEMIRYAKESGTPVFLIGHITKDGNIAGPKVLEHMVDAVLQMEGDRNHIYRLLRATKNRFGSTNELGIYEMRSDGLREVDNPSEILLSSRDQSLSGVAVAATIEGIRPFLIEIQALVSTAAYGTPQRSSTGFDLRRLNMLLAVLEKRCGFKLGSKDVFLNITGGIRVDDPAIDLAVVSAVLSSSEDIPVDAGYCFAAEVGLSGEIRPVNRVEQRISEAEKLGFKHIIISRNNVKSLDVKGAKIEVIPVQKMEDVFRQLFG